MRLSATITASRGPWLLQADRQRLNASGSKDIADAIVEGGSAASRKSVLARRRVLVGRISTREGWLLDMAQNANRMILEQANLPYRNGVELSGGALRRVAQTSHTPSVLALRRRSRPCPGVSLGRSATGLRDPSGRGVRTPFGTDTLGPRRLRSYLHGERDSIAGARFS